MTVADLLETLIKLPPETPVMTNSRGREPIRRIEFKRVPDANSDAEREVDVVVLYS